MKLSSRRATSVVLADLTNLAGLQEPLKSREHAVIPVFASIDVRFLQTCDLWCNLVTSEESDDQINLTFSEVEEMWTILTCDFVAVSDNQGQVGHKHIT